jgi:hypothetical protein
MTALRVHRVAAAMFAALMLLGAAAVQPAEASVKPAATPRAQQSSALAAWDLSAATKDAGGGSAYVIKKMIDGSTVVVDHATGKELPRKTSAYPPIGPYWDVMRWRNAANGHPFVCVRDVINNLTAFHPVRTATYRYDIDDFRTWWGADASTPADHANCYGYSNYYILDVRRGQDPKACTYTYIHQTAQIVDRAIAYWSATADELYGCFNEAEENIYRTTTILGAAFGLEWHIGDGSPSLFNGTMTYLWPQTYDWRTLAYYN